MIINSTLIFENIIIYIKNGLLKMHFNTIYIFNIHIFS